MSNKVVTRPLEDRDLAAVAALHTDVFGPGRFTRSAYRVREQRRVAGQTPSPYCRVACLGVRIVASITLTPIAIGGTRGALLLGPLAVDPEFAGQGHGRRLVAESLDQARADGVSLVVLVGDEPYYGRFGFKRVAPGRIAFPGPVDSQRVLAAELRDGALADYGGLITAET